MAPLGMEAKKKAKTVEVPQLVNYPSAELNEYRLHGGNVVIQGRIVGATCKRSSSSLASPS